MHLAELSNLVVVARSGVRSAAQTLARAFADYPVPRYYYPDETERVRRLPHMCQFLLRYGVRYGEVCATSQRMEGVATWLPWDKVDVTLRRVLCSGGPAWQSWSVTEPGEGKYLHESSALRSHRLPLGEGE